MKVSSLAGHFRWALALLALAAGCRVDNLLQSGSTPTYPPDAPAGLAQYRSDGSTAIGRGETIDEASVTLAGVVADQEAGDTLRLQVEVRQASGSFTGSPTHTGATVTSGATATVSVGGLDPNTAYAWQARTIDRGDRTSDWVAFGTENGQSFRVSVPRGPSTPTDAAQLRLDGSTSIALGAPTSETTVILAATLSDPDEGATISLEVEVRPVTQPFTGVATGTSAPVANGGRGTVAVSVTDDVAYHWQYRGNDGTGRFSAWQTFGGNAESSPDFSVSVADVPGAPTAPAQLRIDGVTPIAAGGSSPEASVIAAATPTDPDPADQLRLQVEIQAVGVAFTGVPTHTSPAVPNGSRASVQLDLADNIQYHWQFRTIDQGDQVGPWAEFGGNVSGTADLTISVPEDPAVPASAGQFLTDGTTPIPTGGVTTQSAVVLRATVNDPDLGAAVRFEIELRPVHVAFTNTATQASAAVAGGSDVSVTAAVSNATSYYWQYRAIDETGRASAWISFGGNNGNQADFSVTTLAPPPNPPGAPAALAQYRADGTTPIATGGSTQDATVVLAAEVSDPDAGDALRLEVEVRETPVALTGTATHSTAGLGSGATGKVTVGGINLAGYHWQARTCDATQCSAWVSFGGNADTADDFVRVP